MLEHVLHDHAVEALVLERERRARLDLERLAAARTGRLDGLGRHVDPGVALEVLAKPGAAAADVEQPRLGREVAHHVAPVPRLLVPRQVAHGGRTLTAGAYHRARAGPGSRDAERPLPRPRRRPAARRRTCAGSSRRSRRERPGARLTVVTTRSGAAALRPGRLGRVGRRAGASLRGRAAGAAHLGRAGAASPPGAAPPGGRPPQPREPGSRAGRRAGRHHASRRDLRPPPHLQPDDDGRA